LLCLLALRASGCRRHCALEPTEPPYPAEINSGLRAKQGRIGHALGE